MVCVWKEPGRAKIIRVREIFDDCTKIVAVVRIGVNGLETTNLPSNRSKMSCGAEYLGIEQLLGRGQETMKRFVITSLPSVNLVDVACRR